MIFRWLGSSWYRRRRKRILRQPFPKDWLPYIERDVRAFQKLTTKEQNRLLDDTQVFIATKRFEAGKGFTITDEVRVTIAAQACLMLLGFDPEDGVFPNVDSVVVNTTSYSSYHVEQGELTATHVLGHTDLHGPVFLSWNAVRHGGYNPADGRNLVFHEFAHKLDLEDGVADGTPVLPGHDLSSWIDVMSAAYEDLCDKADDGRRTLLDHYGATNPAEFFAVATEIFFEKPDPMQRRHPELYHVMSHYYRQDPAARI